MKMKAGVSEIISPLIKDPKNNFLIVVGAVHFLNY